MKRILIILLLINVKSFAQIKIQTGSPQSWVSTSDLATKQQNLGWVNVMDYGADTTGTVDNYQAFTNAEAALGKHGVMYIPYGNYLFTQKFTVDKQIIIKGDGMGSAYGSYAATRIMANTNITLWEINAAGTQILDVGFEYSDTNTAPTSARALYINNTDTTTGYKFPDPTQSLLLRNVSVRGFYENIWIEKCATWLMDFVFNISPISVGLHIENSAHQDDGDWSISNSYFIQPALTPGGIGIDQSGSGGGKLVNVKFNGALTYDYIVNFNQSSSILLISNCSFENFTGYAIGAQNSNYVKIEGCEFSSRYTIVQPYFIKFNTITGGVISNNIFVGKNNTDKLAYSVLGNSNTTVCGNSFPLFTSSTPYSITSSTNTFVCGANVGVSLTGAAAPAITPTSVGQTFTDSTNKKLYISTGTSSSSDWTLTN